MNVVAPTSVAEVAFHSAHCHYTGQLRLLQLDPATAASSLLLCSRLLQFSDHLTVSALPICFIGRMNKGGGSGPTAAAEAQKQKTLMQRVETDIASIVDNFSHLVNVARVNDPPVRNSQESFMMEMRASRMVQAAESLLKLVSKLKQTAILRICIS